MATPTRMQAALDDGALSDGSLTSGSATSELDRLLEFTDALEVDFSGLRSPPGTRGGGGVAFSQADELPPPPRAQRAAAGDVDAKRKKSREKERRKYYRKKARLAGLQQQAATLERQLRALTMAPSTASTPASLASLPVASDGSKAAAGSPTGRSTGRSTGRMDRETLQALVAELAQTKTRLRNENTQLRRQFRQATQAATLISDTLSAECKLYSAHTSYFRLLVPLSVQTCYEIRDEAVEIVRAFWRSTQAAPLVKNVAGWRERRVVDGPLFKFVLEKTFPRASAKFAWAQAWAVLVDPSRNRRLYSEVLDVRVRFVQKIDDDNLVFLEEMRTMDPGADSASTGVIKSAVLLSRFTLEDGFRIHMRALDRDQIELEDLLEPDEDGRRRNVELPYDRWNSSDQLTWLQFEDRGNACVVSFAGMTPTIGANAYFWMAEVVLLCLRCESAILGPRFSLPK